MGLLGLLSGLFGGKAEPETVLLPAADVAAALDRGLEAVLAPAGFEHVGPRLWVRARSPFGHDIVEYEAMKGAAYAPTWGLSFAFAPQIAAKGLKWKRTAKSARLDLRLDRRSAEGFRGLEGSLLSSTFGADPYGEMEVRARRVAQRALVEVDEIRTFADSLPAFAAWEAADRNFGIYAQPYLALPLLRLAAGDQASAEDGLAAMAKRFDLAMDDPLLPKARAAAIAFGQGEG